MATFNKYSLNLIKRRKF